MILYILINNTSVSKSDKKFISSTSLDRQHNLRRKTIIFIILHHLFVFFIFFSIYFYTAKMTCIKFFTVRKFFHLDVGRKQSEKKSKRKSCFFFLFRWKENREEEKKSLKRQIYFLVVILKVKWYKFKISFHFS